MARQLPSGMMSGMGKTPCWMFIRIFTASAQNQTVSGTSLQRGSAMVFGAQSITNGNNPTEFRTRGAFKS